ncbi:MAG TPA: efflux RND transporter periplasmic adaptor subunit [Bryobacteraceae bacterium]|nr:efflux RND transporter periplasmic adaptor subunit [Bryobacteraceae bacterium]
MAEIKYFICCTALVLTGCGSNDKTQAASRKGPSETPVIVASVEKRAVPLELRAIGNVEAFSTVEVKSQISGPIARMLFEEGQDVQQGQVLFEIDPRPLQQTVREMEAEVASRRAALAQAEANLERDQAQAKNSRSQAGRSDELTKQGIIAREQNDQFQTLALAADKAVAATRASIESAKAAIQGAEAKLGEARLQLNYATIRAPISGRAGNVSRKTGNIVSANSDTLVIINQLSPIYASFTVPEQSLPELRRYAAGGKLAVHAMPQGAVSAADGAEGVLDFLDNTVDTASGTILLKARFPNKNRQLWPGQFVNVSVRLANPTETVVPSSAVRTAQQGSYVFVVKPDSTAEQRTIETVRSFDELTVIQSGLNPGEKVIVEGQLRVKPGSKVRIQQPRGEADRARTNSD